MFERFCMVDCKLLVDSGDSKYILTGGEDDLVQVWSMIDRKVVAWGEGHNSWVSCIFFIKLLLHNPAVHDFSVCFCHLIFI